MNVHNFFSLSFPTFVFSSGGGAVAIGRPFVQVGEAAVMWRIAYLGKRINLETFRIVLLYLLFSFMILVCWHSGGVYLFHIKEIFSCRSFHFGLKGSLLLSDLI